MFPKTCFKLTYCVLTGSEKAIMNNILLNITKQKNRESAILIHLFL